MGLVNIDTASRVDGVRCQLVVERVCNHSSHLPYSTSLQNLKYPYLHCPTVCFSFVLLINIHGLLSQGVTPVRAPSTSDSFYQLHNLPFNVPVCARVHSICVAFSIDLARDTNSNNLIANRLTTSRNQICSVIFLLNAIFTLETSG